MYKAKIKTIKIGDKIQNINKENLPKPYSSCPKEEIPLQIIKQTYKIIIIKFHDDKRTKFKVHKKEGIRNNKINSIF